MKITYVNLAQAFSRGFLEQTNYQAHSRHSTNAPLLPKPPPQVYSGTKGWDDMLVCLSVMICEWQLVMHLSTYFSSLMMMLTSCESKLLK